MSQLTSTSLHVVRSTNASSTHFRIQPQPNSTVPLPYPLDTESPLSSTPPSPILPSPSLVAQQFHDKTLLPALIPEPKSPGQGPSHSPNPSCSHHIHNECLIPPSSISELPYLENTLPYNSSARPHCSYIATSTSSSSCSYPFVSPLMQSHCFPQPLLCHDDALPHCDTHIFQGHPQVMTPAGVTTSLPSGPALGCLALPSEQQESLPSFQPFPQVQQTLEHVEVAIPGSIPSSRPCNTVRTSNRKQCIVAGCQELLAPTMWQNHMTLHARGLFAGAVPNFWSKEQDLHCCASCHQLVANSRSSSHSQCCKGRAPRTSNPMDTPSQISGSQNQPNTNLPSFEEVCQLTLPTLRFVPKKLRLSFARVLSATLRQVVLENSELAWLKLFMLPKCVLPSRKCRGCHDVPASVNFLCDLWSKNDFGTLWNLAKCNHRHNHQPHDQAARDNQDLVAYAVSLGRAGLFCKACKALESKGLAPIMMPPGNCCSLSTQAVLHLQHLLQVLNLFLLDQILTPYPYYALSQKALQQVPLVYAYNICWTLLSSHSQHLFVLHSRIP